MPTSETPRSPSIVPHNACVAQQERFDGRYPNRPFHVFTEGDIPFCKTRDRQGKYVGGEIDAYDGTQRLCRKCERAVAAFIARTGRFFTDA